MKVRLLPSFDYQLDLFDFILSSHVTYGFPVLFTFTMYLFLSSSAIRLPMFACTFYYYYMLHCILMCIHITILCVIGYTIILD